MQSRTNIQRLTECAIMIALSTILSLIKVYQMPLGGSVTAVSMVPLLWIALRQPLKWSLLAGAAYGAMQMLFSFYPPPTETFVNFSLVVLLDYVLAFGVLGLAGLIARPFDGIWRWMIGGGIAIALRFLCHFASGIVIWGVYAPESQGAVLYSFLYNGQYMLGELVLSLIVLFALWATLPQKMKVRVK